MNAVWLVPATLAVVAVIVAWWSWQAIAERTAEVRQELQAIPVLADRTRALRAQAERTSGAADATGDYFGSRLRQ